MIGACKPSVVGIHLWVARLARVGLIFFFLKQVVMSPIWEGSASISVIFWFICYCALVVVMIVSMRRVAGVTLDTKTLVVTNAHVMTPLLFDYQIGLDPALPTNVLLLIGIVGMSTSTLGLVSLWDRFSVLPANNGIVSDGIYGIIRHPVYTGYLIIGCSFILLTPTLFNILLFFALVVLTIIRVRCEERHLMLDENYLKYQENIRWKLLPFVY